MHFVRRSVSVSHHCHLFSACKLNPSVKVERRVHTRWRHCASFLCLYPAFLSPLLLYAKLPSTTCWIVSLQRWIKGSMEDLHTSSSSDRQREAQTYSLQIWEVGIAFHTALTWKGIWCRGLTGIISFLFTAVAPQRQMSLQRESDSATKALINGSTLTDCESWWVEGKVELG